MHIREIIGEIRTLCIKQPVQFKRGLFLTRSITALIVNDLSKWYNDQTFIIGFCEKLSKLETLHTF